MLRLTSATLVALCALGAGPILTPLFNAPLAAEESDHSTADQQQLISQAVTWLSAQQQEDGTFTSGEMFRLGITALSTLALLENGVSADDQRIQKALAWLMEYRQADGGIYDPQEGLANYGTGIALMVLARIDGVDPDIISAAQNFMIGNQNTETGSSLEGGFGYGAGDSHRADLSNTAMAIEALRGSGVAADHPAMQRALAFVQRCQNLSSVNDAPWAGNDGSAVYSPDPLKRSGSHNDQEGNEVASGATGIGSMTYALIKSYLLLDVPADDPRVQTALNWVGQNYQFEANPGMAARNKEDGLFYYYLLMASALSQANIEQLTTPDGVVNWRDGLAGAVSQRAQHVEGSGGTFWINNSRRWGEGIPQLTTAYMLRALARTSK